ncbi:MAG: prepilin-type N-terminal cleavage/methylation domain-containing protein [Verrucomicrobiaceae bacterium]|nr:prepilin-type N-terminal cleavage/methylation domain-containing protein [Verrucomicrobiaceae bacterium]
MKLTSTRNARNRGYTLMEVVASAAVLAVGMAGAVSLSASLMVQQEMSWRVAVARNYQENIARLWQLGLTPGEVMSLIPSASGNPKLSEVVGASPTLIATGQVNVSSLGVMDEAVCNFTVNTANVTGAGAGGTNQVTIYRPTLK